MDQSRLGTLPRELRDMVYDDLLVVKNDVTLAVSYSEGPKRTVAIQGDFEHEDLTSSFLCKQFHLETNDALRRDKFRNHFLSKNLHFEISDEFWKANGEYAERETCGAYDYKHSIAHAWINAVGIGNARSIKSADIRLGTCKSKWSHRDVDWIQEDEGEGLLSSDIQGEIWRFGDEFRRLGVPTTLTLQLHEVHEHDLPCGWRKNRCCVPDHHSHTVTLPLTDIEAANEVLDDMYMKGLSTYDDALRRGEMLPVEHNKVVMQSVWRHEHLKDLMETLEEDRVDMMMITPGWSMESDGRWRYFNPN